MRLGLGTVQFGLDYGITNEGGRVPPAQVSRILEAAHAGGIRVLDTAAAYGLSESVLGETLAPEHGFSVVTKTQPLGVTEVSPHDVMRVRDTFHRSLERLHQDSVYGLLVHHAQDVLAKGGDRLVEELLALKQAGLVQKIGVSVYNGTQLDRLADMPLDLVQLPLNVLDQRLRESGHLDTLKRRNVEIHVRSAFLQGLLLMDEAPVSAHFQSVRPHLQTYRDALARHGLTPAQGALGFLRQLPEVDEVIVGVTSEAQLLELLAAATAPLPELAYESFAWTDEAILDPSRWPAPTTR
ncbi:MAG TPA: aldo/keto reductase [Stenomitos sp.]